MRVELNYQLGMYQQSAKVTLNVTEDRIEFKTAPFKFKDEIKAFKGSKWHGFDKPPAKPRKIWSIDNCSRNVFQLKSMMGENVYSLWDQPLVEIHRWASRGVLNVPPTDCQRDMIRRALTHHFVIWGAEMGLGKSLAGIETAERAGVKKAWYVGPLSAKESFELEMEEWGADPNIEWELMTYDGLVSKMRYDFDGLEAPQLILLDELDMCKTPTAHRTIAAQAIADLMREQHGLDCYVIGMSGTSMSKTPLDIWAQAEIVWPGFLREGNFAAFEKRYCEMEEGEDLDGVKYMRRAGYNEVECSQIHKRLEGFFTPYWKSDWLKLPPKQYKMIKLEPDAKVQRVAKTLAHVAPNTITALTWTRALSSGFQYVLKKIGDKECSVCKGKGTYDIPTVGGICPGCAGVKTLPEYERETVKVKTPKDKIVGQLLDECESHGRIVFAGSFQGSIDRIKDAAIARGWATCVVDGRGWRCYDEQGKIVKGTTVMRFWKKHTGKVAFIGNPGSCRYGLTLTLAYMLVFFDNDFSASARLQMEDRIHRMSMTLPAIIVDIVHLAVDELIITTLRNNRKLELLSLGAINESLGVGDDDFAPAEEELELAA